MERYPDETAPSSAAPWRGLKLVALNVLLPLAIALLGVWEMSRAAEDRQERVELQSVLEGTIAKLRPMTERGAGPIIRTSDGRSMPASLALSMAERRLADVQSEASVAAWRDTLPMVALLGGGLAAVLGGLGLAGAVAMGKAGRASRARLLACFNVVRRALPFFMGAQIVLIGVATVSVMLFEAAALWHSGRINRGDAKLIGVIGISIIFAIVMVVTTLWQLRKALQVFQPDPLPVLGREVGREEAAGLWRAVEDLATRCQAQPPEHIVAGLTEGFFVTSSDIVLQPEGRRIAGRTLYVPLPHLAMIDREEAAAIIGHELGHFSGEDTEYSRRFVPIYAGVARSLDAVAESEQSNKGYASFSLLLTRPAMMLGLFVMEQFDHAVHHWSRQREFAADAVGARLTSPQAAASALMRSPAIYPRIQETLSEASGQPQAAPDNLVPAILQAAATRGLEDPLAHLEERQPHPTDTHPPTSQRVTALGMMGSAGPDAAVLERARRPVDPAAPTALDACFTNPGGLARSLTADFLGTIRAEDEARAEALAEAAAAVQDQEQAVFERTGPLVWLMHGLGAVILLCGLAGAGAAMLGKIGGGSNSSPVEPALMALMLGVAVMGAGMIVLGLYYHRRGRKPLLVLGPHGFRIRDVAAEVPWLDVADFTIFHGHAMRVDFLIALGRPMPQVKTKLVRSNPSARTISVHSMGLRGLNPKGYAALLGTYWRAALAKAELAQRRHRTVTQEIDDTMIRAPAEG